MTVRRSAFCSSVMPMSPCWQPRRRLPTVFRVDVAVTHWVEAQVRHLVTVVSLTHRSGVAGARPMLRRGERPRASRCGEFVEIGRSVGKPPAVVQLNQRHAALGDLDGDGVESGPVVALTPQLGCYVVEPGGVLHRTDGQGLDSLVIGVELGQDQQLLQRQVVAVSYGGCHFTGCHLERAHDTGLDPGHGRDVLLGDPFESGQLLIATASSVGVRPSRSWFSINIEATW